ncbi:MAG TPA: hypothetical protein VGZ69_02500 [Candidatus Rhabdochlamydia sp.]|jgi:hypothetical protein|nr:hypothetical protein [Candidatus Rhabdochlamydia sp.]
MPINTSLFSSCPNNTRISSLSLIEKISCPTVLSSFFSSFFSPFNPLSNEPLVPPIFLNEENKGIVNQIANFGKILEQYHPGKIRKLLDDFAEKYTEARENLNSLKDTHTKTLEEFTKKYDKLLLIELPEEQKNKIRASFGQFSEKFNTLINSHNDNNAYDTNGLKEAYDLLDAFNETVMQSQRLYIGLSKVVSYIESKYQFSKEKLDSILLLKEQFNPNLEDQGFNQVTKKGAKRTGLLDLIADVNTILKTLLPKTNSQTIGKNGNAKNEVLKTILEESEKVLFFMQRHIEKHRKSVFKKIRAHLNDDTSSFDDLQNKLERLPNDKKAQGLLLDLKKMRFYLKDAALLSSCNTLIEELGLLLKEQPYLFTKREKIALDCLLENLSVISNGRHFNEEDLQAQLNQCRAIIQELVPKKTIFSQIIDALSILEINGITPDNLINLLDKFINDPKVPFQNVEKEEFSNLKEALLLFDLRQPIPQERISALQLEKHLKLIEEIEKRPPLKEGTKLAIEQELQKLAKHATNLGFMMFIDKTFFNSARDSLFYRNIIQKSEELNSCPKQLFLDELKMQGFSTWKIVSAKVCFFVTKHLRIENYIHNTVSRTISNYSKMIYQKLDQECTHDQFHALSQKTVENATTYFHLLGSAILKAKADAQRFPNPEQITNLIVEQLLSLKPGDNEPTLKELDLHDLYSKLVDNLAERSESSLLKWVVSYLDKPALVSSIIETSIDSLIKPAPNGNASTLNLLIRDGLRILYKKLQQLEAEGSQKEQVLPSSPLAEAFAENLMRSLNEYRDTQQMASSTKIASARKRFLHELREHSPKLEGILDKQVKNYEQIDYNAALLLDAKTTQALKEEKDKEAIFILPVLQSKIMKPLKMLDRLFPQISSENIAQENTVSTTEVISDKTNAFIRTKTNHVIKEKITLALTKLLETPPSEEVLHDWIYQGLALTNQSIERPKENKETQDAVKEEITELLHDISISIANTVPATVFRDFTKIERLSSKLAEKIPYDAASLISPVIQGRLQNIVDLATEKALYQPELLAQLGRRIILPITAL